MNLHIHQLSPILLPPFVPGTAASVDGVSAQAIITAILAGERDPEKLADLRDKRCRSRREDLLEALRGDFRPAYLFVLRQLQQRWQQLQASIAECDGQLAEILAAVQVQAAAPLPEAPWSQRRTHKNMPAKVPIYAEAWRFYGVDLSVVPGLDGRLLGVLMSEVGTGAQLKASFRSAEAFSSWLAVCPENRICPQPPLLPFAQRLRPLAVSLRSARVAACSKPRPGKSPTGWPTRSASRAIR